MKFYIYAIAVVFFVTGLSSCRTTKHVGDGQYLLDKVGIVIDSPAVKPSDMKPYLQQQPNFKVFGVFKWPLYVYNWSGRNENGWLNKQIRRAGEPPVILDTTLIEQTKIQLSRYLSNRGYTRSQITMTIDTSHFKKASLKYIVKIGEPYRIRHYYTHVDDKKIDSIIHLASPSRSFVRSLLRLASKDYVSHIKEDMLFDRTVLDRERQRLTALLRNNGYYAFNRSYVAYLADSAYNKSIVDISLDIKPLVYASGNDSTGKSIHRPYYINSVKIYTDYDPYDPDAGASYLVTDSTVTRGTLIYYGGGGRSIRPNVLQQGCYITPGSLYNERLVEQTYTSFSALKALRYVSVKFDEPAGNVNSDTLRLNCSILTAPAKKQGIRYEVEGTNSAGDLGFASSLIYQHRNLFKGSELFSAKIRGGYEYLPQEYRNYWEFSGETSLHFPRFVFPLISYDFRRKLRATTEFKMSYDLQRRPEYHRSIISGGWNYHWQDRINTLDRHTFKLLDVNYVFLPYISESFKDLLPETTALYNYSNQFIVSMGYTYSFNNYDPMERRRNNYSLRVALESAGNLMYAASELLGAKRDENGRYKLFGINYSEFLKGDIDFARSLTIDARNSLAIHAGLGIAYPFGNTKEIPFERRYYAGGANSNRGWNVRSLGPGRMPLNSQTSFVNQVGDVRMDANIEYRSKLFWKLELALFVDAGNVWTIHSYDYQPNGNFDFNRFYQDIAISYGLGFRFDFDYFLLRFDSGLKAYNPQATGADKWAFIRPNLTNNFAWHFAVGYPF